MQEPTSSFWALLSYLQAVTVVAFTRTSCQLARTKIKMWLWQLISGFLHLLYFADQQQLQQKTNSRPKLRKKQVACSCNSLRALIIFIFGLCYHPFPSERHWWASSVIRAKKKTPRHCSESSYAQLKLLLHCTVCTEERLYNAVK